MRIQVTSVGPEVQKKTSKPNKFGKLSSFSQIEVNYLSNGRAGKRQIMSFNPNNVYDTLMAATEGQEFEITTKQDGEYTNWDTATPVAASAKADTAESTTSTGKPAKGATAFKSTYETPEERAKKQVYIVRQSSIAQAVAFIAQTEGGEPSVADVLNVAKQFENYVFANTEVEEVEDQVEVD